MKLNNLCHGIHQVFLLPWHSSGCSLTYKSHPEIDLDYVKPFNFEGKCTTFALSAAFWAVAAQFLWHSSKKHCHWGVLGICWCLHADARSLKVFILMVCVCWHPHKYQYHRSISRTLHCTQMINAIHFVTHWCKGTDCIFTQNIH